MPCFCLGNRGDFVCLSFTYFPIGILGGKHSISMLNLDSWQVLWLASIPYTSYNWDGIWMHFTNGFSSNPIITVTYWIVICELKMVPCIKTPFAEVEFWDSTNEKGNPLCDFFWANHGWWKVDPAITSWGWSFLPLFTSFLHPRWCRISSESYDGSFSGNLENKSGFFYPMTDLIGTERILFYIYIYIFMCQGRSTPIISI